jgi:hypothetical protein
MPLKSTTVAPALRVLLDNFIDYAGTFPPASLSVERAIANYEKYRRDQYSWMLRCIVIGSGDLKQAPTALDGAISVIADQDENRAAVIETKQPLKASRPVYSEVATDKLSDLDYVVKAGCFAKIRTGGLKPEAIPNTAQVAAFILACAERKLAFKATAGLHHPIRAEYALTYEKNAPRAVMHGFLNVLVAAAFAWHGERDVEPVLAETDASAFSFDDDVHWKDRTLTREQVIDARKNFIHSIGSCSFVEPVDELKTLGLLP